MDRSCLPLILREKKKDVGEMEQTIFHGKRIDCEMAVNLTSFFTFVTGVGEVGGLKSRRKKYIKHLITVIVLCGVNM